MEEDKRYQLHAQIRDLDIATHLAGC